MADKVVPGPVEGSAAVREAVCIHTRKIFDSCRDKDCVEDLRVYPTACSQARLDSALSVRPRSAELLCADVHVKEITFNKGYYTVDVTYFYRVRGETFPGCEPVRREIARLALEKLIADGRIHPTHIEEMVEKARREVDGVIRAEGERAVLETGVRGLHPELQKLLGKLHYRTSYGQNVLQHSIEVSHIAGMMAAELGADVQAAKRAGLLHDIGKALDHEFEGTHVALGVEYARKYREKEDIIHAIQAHHGDVECRTLVACLVQAADAISAARPGARRENLENYIKRLEKLEEITGSYPGVEKSYAIQAGREVRVMVKPEQVSEDEMVILARELAKRIESELEYPGQIKVHVLRETKVVEYAK